LKFDDFIEKTRSLTLWSELPFLQDEKKAYHLNVVGRLTAFLMNSISRKIAASGILVVARKPGPNTTADVGRQDASSWKEDS